ncbi:thiazole-phosphate synthase [Isosphaera pallida ATCC 43644]|uniref:Thiazole synthase n=1 Tax=Isosphaera pallida (strain ATCC 43644 / DSM 9630 / IS1B) TaxID=575540 RepID=E8QZB1_ISOPI|nr:sulfur carrier protein ThiS [Isosphaera pallida]ADV64240.1 thiazole-phosphate synthase [Isosphaera pallida ATCC 43644]
MTTTNAASANSNPLEKPDQTGSLTIQLNGESRSLPAGITLAQLLRTLELDPRRVAVERNCEVAPRGRHEEIVLGEGDVLEIVTLVGGGAPEAAHPVEQAILAPWPRPEPLQVGSFALRSRLWVGTGKYADLETMRDCLEASGAEVVTVAVRRERLIDRQGRNLLDALDPSRYIILPNTAGCFTVEEALRTARLGRELLEGLGNPGARWVKLEVLADPRTLLPDPVATLQATEALVAEGFEVLCYTSDDPVMARRLKAAGASCVMPAGSPIGSGQGVLNPNNIQILLEDLKGDNPNYPVVIDAGVGTASDVTVAMELGCDGVLLNTAIARAQDPRAMAHAMRLAIESGYLAARAGRIARKLYATASSPLEGTIHVGQTRR